MQVAAQEDCLGQHVPKKLVSWSSHQNVRSLELTSGAEGVGRGRGHRKQ